MDIKQIYREETELDVYSVVNLDDGWCFSNDYVKWLEAKLTLTDVSQQRELLLDFMSKIDRIDIEDLKDGLYIELSDRYLSNNCG